MINRDQAAIHSASQVCEAGVRWMNAGAQERWGLAVMDVSKGAYAAFAEAVRPQRSMARLNTSSWQKRSVSSKAVW